MKRDLNLFTAYKNGSVKLGGKSNKGLVLLIAVFVVLVAGTYGYLFLRESNFNSRTAKIKAELSEPSVIDTNNKLSNQLKKNELLKLYNEAVKTAQKNYDASMFLDKSVLDNITSSLPASVSVDSIKITAKNVSLSCSGANPLDAAVLAQALDSKGIFTSVTYQGVVKGPTGYAFSMNCDFKEKTK